MEKPTKASGFPNSRGLKWFGWMGAALSAFKKICVVSLLSESRQKEGRQKYPD
jgi:hypothetical protein